MENWTYEDTFDKDLNDNSDVESVHSKCSDEELEVALSNDPNSKLLKWGDQPDLPVLVQSMNLVPTATQLFPNAAPATCEGFSEEGRVSPACLALAIGNTV